MMEPNIEIGSVWRHRKSFNLYKIISANAYLEASGEPAVIYQSAEDDRLPWWCRAKTEFLDGRFVPA